jgi:hypothetical protein
MADNSFAIRLILILIAVVILVVLITQYNKNKSVEVKSVPPLEKFETSKPTVQSAGSNVSTTIVTPDNTPQNEVLPSEPLANEDYKAVDFQTTSATSGECFPRDKTTVEDLLPKDAANTTWAQVNPAGQGDVKDQNFLNAGHHVGMNTVGQTLRNPNYQLRSEPPNPKLNLSPWNQSTIEYDSSRRVFEVGEC